MKFFIFQYHKGKLAGIAEVSEAKAISHVKDSLSGHVIPKRAKRRKTFHFDLLSTKQPA